MTVKLVVWGAGARGTIYADWAAGHPDRAQVVAVADPNPARRDALASRHGIARDQVHTTWQESLAAGRLGDAVLICTQDTDHVEPAIAALEAGYDVLLEKPIAPQAEAVRRVAAAAQETGRILAVSHVLRNTPYTTELVRLLREGVIGDIASIQHLEPVGWWHQAHSYVRGSWRREDESSSMLLAKACHDLDWLEFVVGQRIARVASFGSLRHFTAGNAPEGATDRCVSCPHQDTCAYSATRIYLSEAAAPPDQWPSRVLTDEHTREALERAVAEGPYGRCVYACDNDVVDHQVVALEFADGATGTFTMTAFTPYSNRLTRVFGTQGMIESDGATLRICDFRAGGAWREVVTASADASSGHAGGDDALMDAFVAAVAAQDQGLVSSDAASSLASHLAVFAAEESRLTGRVVDVR